MSELQSDTERWDKVHLHVQGPHFFLTTVVNYFRRYIANRNCSMDVGVKVAGA